MACHLCKVYMRLNTTFSNPVIRPQCTIMQQKVRAANTETKTKSLQKNEKLRGYVLTKYMNFVSNYKKIIETRFPSAMNMYRVFSVGLKDFYQDLKFYIPKRIRHPPNEKSFSSFTRAEIELFDKMPRDMWKIAPVLILSAIPFGNYVIFPLALLKPRIFLTSHFWSVQQKAEYCVLDLQKRISHNKTVYRCLVGELETIDDADQREGWRRVLSLLGSGVHPTPGCILTFKPLFQDKPYSLNNLGYYHVSHLLRMHGLSRGIFRRRSLYQRAFLLSHLDRAIMREGGPSNMSVDCLRNACSTRGLHSSHLSRQDMVDWLNKWMEVSKQVDESSYSFLLHFPLFFAYNHPQNWKIMI